MSTYFKRGLVILMLLMFIPFSKVYALNDLGGIIRQFDPNDNGEFNFDKIPVVQDNMEIFFSKGRVLLKNANVKTSKFFACGTIDTLKTSEHKEWRRAGKMYYIVYAKRLGRGESVTLDGKQIELTVANGAFDKEGRFYTVQLIFSNITIYNAGNGNFPGNSVAIMMDNNDSGKIMHMAESVEGQPLSGLSPEDQNDLRSSGKVVERNGKEYVENSSRSDGNYLAVSYTTEVKIFDEHGNEVRKNIGIRFNDIDQPNKTVPKVDNHYPFSGDYVEGVEIRNINEGLNTNVGIYVTNENTFCDANTPCRGTKLQFQRNGNNVRIFAGAVDDAMLLNSLGKATSVGSKGETSSFVTIGDSSRFQYKWSGSGCETGFGFVTRDYSEMGHNLTVHQCNKRNPIKTDNCGGVDIVDQVVQGAPVKRNLDSIALLLNRYIPVTHTSCNGNNNVSAVMNFYVRTSYDVYRQKSGGGPDTKATRCAKVQLTVPVVIGEDIKLSFGKLSGSSGEDSIYAGGGFKWADSNSNSIVQNNVLHLYYKYLLNDTDPMFKVKYFYYEKIRDNYIEIKDGDKVYRTLNYFGGKIYSDSSCNVEANFNNEVWKYLENQKIFKTYTLDNKFTSVDNNDKNKESKISFNVDSSSGFSGSNNLYEMKASAKLKTSWINKQTALVSTSDHSGDADYINDGNIWHIPLKYTDDKVKVYTNETNISIIRGEALKFTTMCSIPVKNLVYGSSGDFKVRYRSIDVNDPFNGKRKKDIEENASNWSSWYCGNDSNCTASNAHKTRINKSYSLYPDSPLYKVVINFETAKKIKEYNESHPDYYSFSGIDGGGRSDLIKITELFKENRANSASEKSFCGLGSYDGEPCDRYRIG